MKGTAAHGKLDKAFTTQLHHLTKRRAPCFLKYMAQQASIGHHHVELPISIADIDELDDGPRPLPRAMERWPARKRVYSPHEIP